MGSLKKVHINNLTSAHHQTHLVQKLCPVFRKEMSQMLAGKATGQTPRGEKVEKKTYKRRVKVMGLLNVRKKRVRGDNSKV